MAFFRGDINSKELGMETSINVILPNDFSQDKIENNKVLYLLHGQSDNASAWVRNTRIEQYAKDHQFIIVMPEVQRSFYTDMAFGLKYFSYISDELPKLCRKIFRISDKREDTYIAGLSMGGYGALKCVLIRPDVFSKCGAFSSATDIGKQFAYTINETNTDYKNELIGIFGEIIRPEDDLYNLATKLSQDKSITKPQFYMTCGYSDFLYEQNIRFRDHMRSLPFDFKYVEWEGQHEWGFWDKSIQLMLEHFSD